MITDKIEPIEYLPRRLDYLENLGRNLRDLQGSSTLINELIQNADDAPGASIMSFDIRPEGLVVDNNGSFTNCGHIKDYECRWLNEKGHRCDFHSFSIVGGGDKMRRANVTGKFGIGFTAVYQITDHPELISSNKHWILHEEEAEEKRIWICQGCPTCQILNYLEHDSYFLGLIIMKALLEKSSELRQFEKTIQRQFWWN
jgi:hypothetical protein